MYYSKKVFLLTLFLISLFSGKIFSQNTASSAEQLAELDYSSLKWIGDKAYFTSDQLIISDKGIFVLIQDCNKMLAKVLVSQVNFDEAGLFVLAEHFPSPQIGFCRYGHPTCRNCGRCSNSGCPTPPCRCK